MGLCCVIHGNIVSGKNAGIAQIHLLLSLFLQVYRETVELLSSFGNKLLSVVVL